MEQFEIAKAAASLIGAMVIAFLAVFLALRRYYSEKLSERKWEAFNGLFDVLHHVRNYYDQQWEYTVHRQTDLAAEEEKRLEGLRPIARKELAQR